MKLKFQVKDEIKNTIFAVGITTIADIPINTTWSSPQNLKKGKYEIEFLCDEFFFQKGIFKIVLGVSRGKDSLYYDDNFLQFEVCLISKNINENLIKVDGSTGIILNQLRTNIYKI